MFQRLFSSSLEDLTKDCLGFAEDVYEHVLVRHNLLMSIVFLFENDRSTVGVVSRAKKSSHLSKAAKILNQ
jgi:hypothetical protein